MSVLSQQVFVERLLQDYATAQARWILQSAGSVYEEQHRLGQLRGELEHRALVWKSLTGQQIDPTAIRLDGEER